MKGSSSNAKMNVLLCGLVSTSFLLITKDFYVYDLPASAIRGDDNSSKIFLGEAKPLKLEEKWPILASNLNFKEIRHAIYNAFTVMDDTSEYLLFITWSKTDPELVGVTYDLKKNKVMPRKHSYRFNGKVKQVMLSASKKMLFYGLRDKDESGKKGLQIAEFKFNGRNLYSSSGMKRTGAWMAICGNGKGEMHLSKGKTSKCDPVEWRNVIKGFIDGDQVYLFGTQYIYIFDLDAVTGPGKVVPISKKRYDEFLLCHYDYLKWAIIALALLFLLLFLLILLWLCCCRGRRKKGGGTGTGTKSKKHKKSKSNKRKSYKSMTNAVTRRSRGGTKKTLKSKGKSKSSKGKSKYKSHFNDATGRSVFKQKNK